ncbi:MAG TPA: LytTR family DNA-binding domain-containing protein [Saprospiraceae bacterium]|nr:LytTR family DNA-binding domain-containing protein [Saprospiraceae bacterium]HNT22002.1 LytTR family DNA-binding domain-containing protein [Saprospiraceae bacterium]
MKKNLCIYHIDDEYVYLDQVRQIVEQTPGLIYLGGENNAEKGLKAVQNLRPDILLLDIEMPGKNGLYVADQLKGSNTFIVFLTNYTDYSIAAFNAFALHYLLKPLSQMALLEVIERYKYITKTQAPSFAQKEQLQELKGYFQKQLKYPTRIFINTQKEIIVLPLNEIVFLSAEGSYTSFSLKDGRALISGKNLKTYASVVEQHPDFVRVHRSYIINQAYLDKIEKKKPGLIFHFTSGTILSMNSFRKEEWFDKLNLVQ